MNVRPKRLPRLWCARLGLLPFDVALPGDAHRPGPLRSGGAAVPGVPARHTTRRNDCDRTPPGRTAPPGPT